MKVVIINKSATGGGAAVAAKRLYEALEVNGIKASMLVQDEIKDSTSIQSLSNSKREKRKSFLRFIQERLYFLPYEKNKSIRYSFSPAIAGIDISKHPLVQEADIIHLHWINHGFLSIDTLEKLFALGKPVVWTMHDMWPFTGGCHYAVACHEFIESCGFCPFLRKSFKDDLSSRIHAKKRLVWKKANLNAVSCSNWLGSIAQESSLLRQKKISSIPNPINTQVFSPKDSKKCREELGLPKDKKLLLFGAANISDPRKGSKYLIESLNILDQKHPHLKDEFELVVFGKSNKKQLKRFPFKVNSMKFISCTDELVKLYSAADAFVLPSLQDNLPNTVMESLACGVPVIGFRVGGVPEMIEHQKSGFLAEARDSESLANGIVDVLFHDNLNSYKKAARSFALDNFDNKVVADQYIALYSSLMNK
ncbi:glycosyltransferase [Labilibacter sediminis]|nr:glycosyltransferase [Labilibacter sediminis]